MWIGSADFHFDTGVDCTANGGAKSRHALGGWKRLWPWDGLTKELGAVFQLD